MPEFEWSVALFGMNEARTIGACLSAINDNALGRATHVTVLLNGTTDDSAEVVRALRLPNLALSLYLCPVADKTNAINQFLHRLRPSADLYVCIDAYATIGPNSLQALADALRDHPEALAAVGIPANGRSAAASAAAILRGGAVSGQLYALRPSFVDRLAALNLRLPFALYRGDGLLGSMAMHDLDALHTGWDERRVIGVRGATFTIPSLSLQRWRDVRRQFRREIRQARGRIETEALKAIIYERGYAALPGNADDMLRDWLDTHAVEPRSLRERVFLRLAIRQLRAARKPAPGDLEPTLAFSR